MNLATLIAKQPHQTHSLLIPRAMCIIHRTLIPAINPREAPAKANLPAANDLFARVHRPDAGKTAPCALVANLFLPRLFFIPAPRAVHIVSRDASNPHGPGDPVARGYLGTMQAPPGNFRRCSCSDFLRGARARELSGRARGTKATP